ncbi:MAG TPA: ATP-binding protein [Verrucomicrobiae bacterium]|nr:ATP-binding protein [Verrucomicrobiae bacterium]
MMQPWSWRIAQANGKSVASSRHAFAQALREAGHRETDIETAVMIFGELVANACEHGTVPVDIQLRTHRNHLILDVLDSGHDIARPAHRNPESLRGRGFEIIERLGGVIAINPRPRSRVTVTLPL